MGRKRVDEGAYHELVGKAYDQRGENLRKRGRCYICQNKFSKTDTVCGIDKETGKAVDSLIAKDVFFVHKFHVDVSLRPE